MINCCGAATSQIISIPSGTSNQIVIWPLAPRPSVASATVASLRSEFHLARSLLSTCDADPGRMDSRGGLRVERHLQSNSEASMTMTKSMLLSSASMLVALSAQAADLPAKAKPVEYVKICNLYGAGFYYMPGTDTCIKIGGYVR